MRAKLGRFVATRNEFLWAAFICLTFLVGAIELMAAAEIALQHWYVLTVPMMLAAFRYGRRGAMMLSTVSLGLMVGVFYAAGQSYAEVTGMMQTLLEAAQSTAEAQRVALQLADLRAQDPDAAFPRALLGLGSMILTSILLGNSVDSLAALSWSDGLTGLANRRRFDTALSEEWRRAARHRAPLALMMIDIDHFKAYNDAFGHGKGDECLRRVAQELSTAARRAGDLVARYGGEEFVALLPDTSVPGVQSHAEALLSRVEALRIANPGSTAAPHVTVSIGIACVVPTLLSTSAELMSAADQALYRAKEQGRNRACLAPEPELPDRRDGGLGPVRSGRRASDRPVIQGQA